MKYLKTIPKPLLDDFLNGSVIPFVGAGFSKNADIPAGVNMPDWKELGQLAADSIPDYVFEGDSIDALSYYEELYSRPKLVEFIIKNTGFGKISPGKVYEAFCNLFTGTICTTNFDSLIENELALLKRPFSTIVTEDRLSVKNVDECRVIKVHGDYDHPNKMVITENDFDRFLIDNPIMATYIANLFIGNTMLLVGYSLDDNDLRGILQIINDRLGKMTLPVYCITLNASQEKIDRYKRRNIKVINFIDSKTSYRELFFNLFSEIREYVENQRKKVMTSGDDRINAQLAIPPTENNLCFLSCAYLRTSRITRVIKPLLKSIDVELVELGDVLAPGETRIDTVTTLISKCNVAIVDLTEYSKLQEYEIQILLEAEPQKTIIFICEDVVDENYRYIAASRPIYLYSADGSLEEEFSLRIVNALLDIKEKSTGSVARRLFNKHEYSASVTMAYSELESYTKKSYQEIRNRKEYYTEEVEARRVYSFNAFVLNFLNLSNEEEKEFRQLTNVRNSIVHFNSDIDKKQAERCLKIASELIQKVDKWREANM